MVPWWKRLIFSLTSFILAVAFLCFLVSIRRGLGNPPDPKGVLQLFCYAAIMVLYFSYPAWLFALPAVLFLTNLTGWRFWAILALGTLIGPMTFLLENLTFVHHSWSGTGILMIAAAVISGLSTFIYLVLLRRSQRTLTPNKSPQP